MRTHGGSSARRSEREDSTVSTKTLSDKQQRILEFIGEFLDEHHFPPTVRDIQAGCEISSTSVVDYNLRILQREGYLKRQAEVSRGIELLDDSFSPRRDMVHVPILGSIAAGEPLQIPSSDTWKAVEIDSVDLPSFMTGGKPEVFATKGQGRVDDRRARIWFFSFLADSHDGDLVLMEPVSRPENGDMVAAFLKDKEEVTLKHFQVHNGTVTLQPRPLLHWPGQQLHDPNRGPSRKRLGPGQSSRRSPNNVAVRLRQAP